MADNIDSLQIEISANAGMAEKSLDRLADSLLRLQGSLKGISGGQFQNLSSGIRQMSDAMTRFTSGVKTADFTRIATGLNKLAGVNVQGVSDASRAISTLTANLNQIGNIAFDSQGIANIANAIAQLGRKTVTQATANIPALTQSLSSLVTGLNQIGTVSFDISSLSQLVAAITKLGGKSATTAASGNIDKLAVALKNMMTILSRAPAVSNNLIQMTQALAQLATSGSRAGTATRSLTASFGAFNVSSGKAAKSAGGLAAAFGKFYATYWLLLRSLGMFKKAIDISSDLTEVQNVVDVTFGHMSDTMNEFADSALKNYGMSELMAKQIASRFQAMGVAMGFAQGHMTEMSIELTKLAGDMASFYNVSQDQIATALQSIFTGETEPLRRFGLDLSFATVEAWALANGLEADMQKMTQAEKTMLRYQYVMANTGAASGDFLRTVNSWHNQLVLLSGAFQQLGSIVGGVLINAFKPFIQALNSVMGAVINFAQVVSDALGAIFGWEYQTGGGVANDMESAAGAAGDLEDATGGAAKNAKELNRYIAAWHEVNNMTSNEGSGGSGGGGGGGTGGGAGTASGGEWIQKESLWEKYTSSIDTLYELGEYISGVLTDAMNSIDWDSVYEGARNFGSGLASFLNGLISPQLFGATGTTIAGALNTAIYAALSFGETFDWTDFGESIAAGVNNFFATFDFGSLANAIDVWVQGIWTTLTTAISKIEWDKIWDGVIDFISNLDLKTVAIIIGAATISKIGKVLFANGVLSGVSNLIGTAISKIPLAIESIKILASGNLLGATGFLSNLANAFALAAGGAGTLHEALVLTFGTLGTTLAGIVSVVGGAVTAVSSFFGMWQNGFSWLNEVLMVFGIALTAVGAVILGAPALVAGAVAGIVAAVGTLAVVIHDNWDSIVEFFSGIPEKIAGVWSSIVDAASQKWNELIEFMSGLPEKVGEIISSISQWFSELPYNIGYALGEALGKITSWAVDTYEYLKTEIPKTVSDVVSWFGELPGKAYSAISTFFSDVATWASNVYSTFSTKVSEIVSAVVTWFADLPGKAYDEIIKIKDKITQWGTETIGFFETEVPKIVDKVVEFFSKLPDKIKDVGKKIVEGLWNGIKEKVDWLGTQISGFVDGVIDGFKEGFEIHSPSRIAFEIGDYFTLGLGNGITNRFNDIYKDINAFTDNVSTTRISMPKVDILPDISKYRFKPAKINVGEMTGKIREAIDYTFASGGFIDYDRLGQAVYEAQSQAMQENPLKIGDRDVFEANTRETIRYGKRTGKMPYPIY